MAASRHAEALERLQRLADLPQEQAAYAARVIEKERRADVVLAALAVLREREDPRLRPLLLGKYGYCDANGVRRDPGGAIRKGVLRALRPVALPVDAPLFERATTTYEFLFGEAVGDLRAEGLLTLNEVDPILAGYHCVRLLTDQYTSIMSGEPAVTAVRVLAAQGQLLPLYAYVMGDQDGVADVTAECLRGLAAIPPSVLAAVIEKYRNSDNEIVLLGLFDLLLTPDTRPAYIDFILDFLRTTTRYNLYRYLVITLIAARDSALIQELEAIAAGEADPSKAAIWQEAHVLT